MSLRDQYDWVVLGDDIGALLSASLAARIGLSVLVLPLENPPTPRTTSDGSVLDLETNYILGLGKNGLLTKCLQQVGMTPQEESVFAQRQSFPQILSRDARITLHGDRVRFSNEIQRELGAKIFEATALMAAIEAADEEVDSYWTGLPARLTLKPIAPGQKKKKRRVSSLRTFDDLARQLARAPSAKKRKSVHAWFSQSSGSRSPKAPEALDEFLQGAWTALTASDAAFHRPRNFEILHLLSLSRTGASFPGGMGGFREFLLRLARRSGAEIPAKTYCRRVFFQGGAFAGVLASGRGGMIPAGGGILGAPLQSILPILTVSERGWFRKLKTSPKPVGWRFSLALLIQPEALPPGFTSRTIWQESDAPPIHLERLLASDYRVKETRKAILCLRTMLPMTKESLSVGYQRMVAARMLRKASEIIPFLEFHVARVFPDFRPDDHDLASHELRALYDFDAVEDIPHYLLCYAGKGLGSQSGIEGFFTASPESFPELGNFGSTIAAVEGVAWAAHRAGLPGPFGTI